MNSATSIGNGALGILTYSMNFTVPQLKKIGMSGITRILVPGESLDVKEY
jgi:hypothetical protein